MVRWMDLPRGDDLSADISKDRNTLLSSHALHDTLGIPLYEISGSPCVWTKKSATLNGRVPSISPRPTFSTDGKCLGFTFNLECQIEIVDMKQASENRCEPRVTRYSESSSASLVNAVVAIAMAGSGKCLAIAGGETDPRPPYFVHPGIPTAVQFGWTPRRFRRSLHLARPGRAQCRSSCPCVKATCQARVYSADQCSGFPIRLVHTTRVFCGSGQ
jgi:hypothetical protein